MVRSFSTSKSYTVTFMKKELQSHRARRRVRRRISERARVRARGSTMGRAGWRTSWWLRWWPRWWPRWGPRWWIRWLRWLRWPRWGHGWRLRWSRWWPRRLPRWRSKWWPKFGDFIKVSGYFTRHFGVLRTPLVHFFTGPHWRLLRRDGRRRVSIKIIAVVERV